MRDCRTISVFLKPLRRVFALAWILSAIAGALNHTFALRLLGRRFDLFLPHLQYGYVMFSKNPRTVPVVEFARSDGIRHHVADLVARPAFGYKRARVTMDIMVSSRYLETLCNRAQERFRESVTIFFDEYMVDSNGSHLTETEVLTCGTIHGINH